MNKFFRSFGVLVVIGVLIFSLGCGQKSKPKTNFEETEAEAERVVLPVLAQNQIAAAPSFETKGVQEETFRNGKDDLEPLPSDVPPQLGD